MTAGMLPPPPNVLLPPPPAPPRPDAIVPVHAGLRWRLECEPLSFVLRDRRHPTSSVRRFPRTELGWAEAWNEYLRLEAWHRPGWPTRGPWILANLIIGFFGVSFAVFGVLNALAWVVARDRLPIDGPAVIPLATIGFMLLLYLPAPRRVRVIVFLVLVGLASILTFAGSG